MDKKISLISFRLKYLARSFFDWAHSLYRKVRRVAISIGRKAVSAYNFFFKATNDRRSIASTIVIYVLLVLFGFIYVYPLLYMFSYSFMSEADVINPLVVYVPVHWTVSNYVDAFKTLNFLRNLGISLLVSVIPSLLQCVACSLIAYALARFRFKGKKVLFGAIVLTFVVPSEITMIPTVLIMTSLKIIDTLWTYVIMAFFGQGLRSAVFVLIFYQFFVQIPKSLEESAKIDGANTFVIFWNIGVRSALPAFILTFLLSFVWYYNETALVPIYLGSDWTTLVSQLEVFKSSYDQLVGGSGKAVNEAIYMAGTLVTILPLLAIYFLTQKFFVSGIDKAGITGE